VNRAVAERGAERLVDEPVLLEQREPCEAAARHGHLEVVAAARAVLDVQLGRVGKRVSQQGLQALGGHDAIVGEGAYPGAMEEIGLFPLGIVLLPTEVVPLHIFEERYQELIGECLELGREFGLVYADDDGVRETGTRARVAEVLERFDDGRLNVLVEGGERFHVERLTRGRAFLTAEVEPVEDEWDETDAEAAERATEAFRALAAAAGAEAEAPEPGSPWLSFAVAARVEIEPGAKQELLELRSESARLARVRVLLDAARETLLAAKRLGEHAKRNGTRLL
jgi:ATP-dependent Lon protease